MAGKKGYTVIAALHLQEVRSKAHFEQQVLPGLKRTGRRIEELFAELAAEGRKRTLFVEGEPDFVLNPVETTPHFTATYDPFVHAIQLARSHGWNVEPLDKDWSGSGIRIEMIQNERVRRFLECNYRHRFWAVNKKPKQDDLVLVHPNHVKGFLMEKAAAEEKFVRRVAWVDRPDKQKKGSLNAAELKQLLVEYQAGTLPYAEDIQAFFEEWKEWEKRKR